MKIMGCGPPNFAMFMLIMSYTNDVERLVTLIPVEIVVTGIS